MEGRVKFPLCGAIDNVHSCKGTKETKVSDLGDIFCAEGNAGRHAIVPAIKADDHIFVEGFRVAKLHALICAPDSCHNLTVHGDDSNEVGHGSKGTFAIVGQVQIGGEVRVDDILVLVKGKVVAWHANKDVIARDHAKSSVTE